MKGMLVRSSVAGLSVRAGDKNEIKSGKAIVLKV